MAKLLLVFDEKPISRRRLAAILWVCLPSCIFQITQGKLAAAPARLAQDELPTATLEMLREANGSLTPDVRASYVKWARDKVIGQITAMNRVLPEDVLNEIDSDPTLSDGLFTSVYPPDASILSKYIELRSKLGEPFVRRYRSLVVAAAVAHRKGGVSDRIISDDEKPDPEDLEADTPLPEPNDRSGDEGANKLVTAIADFMKSSHYPAIEIYDDASKKQQLITFLKSRQISDTEISQLDKPKRLGRELKSTMIVLGKRPAERQPSPELSVWLKYLAMVYERSPTLPKAPDKDPMHWPLFPMDKAPWPLLMPLARPMPLDEARYIYAKFEGKHGPDRYHTYGPYRKWEAQLRAELVPSVWHWAAWPDRIVHGGVCVVMSGIAIDTHRSLCQPAVPAGQPHHSNLITYRYEDGAWCAQIQQAFAGGPPVTHALWMFNDVSNGPQRLVKKSHAGAEYHLGLGAAMNLGLRTYIDTRIASSLYQALSDSEKPTIGNVLLTQATKTNPFNPEPWYRLAGETKSCSEGLALASTILAHVPNADLERVGKGIEKQKEKKGKKKKAHAGAALTPVEVARREYWETLAKFVIQVGIERHKDAADPKELQAVNGLLRRVGLRAIESGTKN